MLSGFAKEFAGRSRLHFASKCPYRAGVMGVAKPIQRLTETEYLELDRGAEGKSEFYEGEVFAMSGGTRWHSLIAANLSRELGNQLRGRCLVYDSNLRIKVEVTGLHTYPDVTVACGEPRFADQEQDTLLNPTLLVEVLSASTEAYDRGKKFEHYRRIPSLREYLLVSQTEPRIEQFICQGGGEWLLRDVFGIENRLALPSLDIAISLGEVFAHVQFPEQALRSKGVFPSPER
jgi:Uma2 family endonuclease